jgi:hypothetical protein
MKKLIKESLNENLNKNKPKIFRMTIYRLPTENELIEVDSYNLSSDEIVNGFCYTIVGKGILDQNSKERIINCIKMLLILFPDNQIYKEALEKAKDIQGRHIKF